MTVPKANLTRATNAWLVDNRGRTASLGVGKPKTIHVTYSVFQVNEWIQLAFIRPHELLVLAADIDA